MKTIRTQMSPIIRAKHVSIFNCFCEEGHHKETSDLSLPCKYGNLKYNNGVVWVEVGSVTV